MVYLFLGCLLFLLVLLFCSTNRVSVFCEISKETLIGTMHCKSWINWLSAEWRRKSDGYHFKLRFLIFSIPFSFRRLNRQKEKDAVRDHTSIYSQIKYLFSDFNRKLDLFRLLHKEFHIGQWEINGQTSYWDPATTGIIFIFIRFMKHMHMIPANVHIRSLFYPAPSFIRCHGEGHFKFIHLFSTAYRERTIWLPWVSGKQHARRRR